VNVFLPGGGGEEHSAVPALLDRPDAPAAAGQHGALVRQRAERWQAGVAE